MSDPIAIHNKVISGYDTGGDSGHILLRTVNAQILTDPWKEHISWGVARHGCRTSSEKDNATFIPSVKKLVSWTCFYSKNH